MVGRCAVHIRFDGPGVLEVATRLQDRAAHADDLGRRAAALRDGLTDPALTAALELLGDVCADVLEVSALDLELLSSLVRSGLTVYRRVEHAAMQGSGQVSA